MSVVGHYQKPSRVRSIWQLMDSVIPYLGLLVAMYFALRVSYWLTLGLAVLAAGFLIRIFIIFHDCGHGSFFRSSRINHFCGVLLGILTYTPFSLWHRKHAIHHESSGDLTRRGVGDVWTMTVAEYRKATPKVRRKYAFYRNPFVMLILGPLNLLLIHNRRSPQDATSGDRLSVWIGNLSILAILGVSIATIGLKTLIMIQLPVYWIAASAGIWLFYVQHQFEDVYWEKPPDWQHVAASLDGSSFYKLPKVIQWFTGNIGYHHIHHLSSTIPNYYLPKCHEELVQLRSVHHIGIRDSLKSLNLRLWDETSRRMVGFCEVRSKVTAM